MIGVGLGLGRAAPVRGFNPAKLSGLVLDLDAGVGITLNGSRLSGGAGHNGAQATAAQQPLVTTGQNGRAVLRGDGARRVDVAGMATPTSATYVFVASGATTAADEYLASGINANFGILLNYEGGGEVSWFNTSDVHNFGPAATDRSLHIFTVTQVNGASLVGYIDAVQVFSAAPASVLQPIASLMTYATATATGTDGDLARVLAWNRVLAAGELASVHGYLKARYAIS
jgi:hypothetical protein